MNWRCILLGHYWSAPYVVETPIDEHRGQVQFRIDAAQRCERCRAVRNLGPDEARRLDLVPPDWPRDEQGRPL